MAGCSAVRASPAAPNAPLVCEISPDGAALRVWVPEGGGALTATLAGETSAVTETPLPEGRRAVVQVPSAAPGARRVLEVCVDRGEQLACTSFETEALAPDPRLAEALRCRAAKDRTGALAALVGVEGTDATAARARSLRARLALSAGDTAAAIAGLSASLELHLAEGRLSDGVLDAFALAYVHTNMQHAFGRALDVLDRAAEAAARWDEGAAQIDYYRALALRDSGRPREALAALARSGRLAAALDMAAAHRHAREVEARLLQSLGRHTEAMRTFEALASELGPDAEPCVRGEVLSAWAWSELRALLAGALRAPPPSLRRRMEEVLDLSLDRCPSPLEVDNTTVNLALEAYLAGDLDRAQERLRALEGRGTRAAYIEVWRLDLAGRIALARAARGGAPAAEGRTAPASTARGGVTTGGQTELAPAVRRDLEEALSAYDALAARARLAVSPEPLLRALSGRGRALAALGRRDDAIQACSEAEDLLDEELGRLPAGEERALFLDEQGATAQELVELLSGAGRASDALAAARRARSRNVRQALRMERVTALAKEERARFEAALAAYREARAALAESEELAWQRPRDDREGRLVREAAQRKARAALDEAFDVAGMARGPAEMAAQPAGGEVWLLFDPKADGTCRVFAVTPGGVRTFLLRVPPTAPAADLAAALLGPLEAELAGARRLRVLASGPWQATDVHALPFRGRPLAAHVPVAYTLDLPAAGAAEGSGALVVANPEEDLPQTEREASFAEARLRPGTPTSALRGARATKPAFVEAVGRVGFLHFAGHAEYAGGWDTGLRLAGGLPFTVRDVLALPRAPARVVLSGCETARSAPTRALDLGLPEAFVVRGAAEVIAAMRPVDDAMAADLMDHLYRITFPGEGAPPLDLASALARAQAGAWERDAGGDWAAYRVIVR